MNFFKEIGGYLQLDSRKKGLFHNGASVLNSARSALRGIVREFSIKRIQVPYYTCPVVWQALEAEACETIPYDISDTFEPLKVSSKLPLLYTNYFGIGTNIVQKLAESFPSLIVDNAQAFYAKHTGMAGFYSPRKFFGLPDGGLALPALSATQNLEQATSWEHCSHLLKRWDLGAGAGYPDFQHNDAALNDTPILAMSNLTYALLGNVDFESVRKARRRNFSLLHGALGEQNLLDVRLSDTDVPMLYPFRTKDTKLRRRLIENKIFVATYWPQQQGCGCMSSASSQKLANEILPLPIDQRYEEEDMNRILEVIHG